MRSFEKFHIETEFLLIFFKFNIVGDALMRGLAAKGHDVTMVSPHKQTKFIRNYRSIHLEKTLSDARKGTKNEMSFEHVQERQS